MEDIRQLVERMLGGDAQAVEELVRRFQRMAVGYAWSMVGDFHEAEDLAQEAFVQALASIGTLQNPAAFPSWFRTILRYTCLRARRERRGRPLSLDEGGELVGGPTPEDGAESREVREQLWRSLNQLSEEDRSVLVLYYFEELTHRQIAAFLGLAESRVNNRLHALRTKLRKEWREIMDYRNQDSGETFRRRVLQGVQKIGYSAADGTPMLNQFCGSFSAALASIGADGALDYAFIAASSGAAFRMMWKEGWHPDNVDLCHLHEEAFLPMQLAFEATGCSVEICLCRDSKVAWQGTYRARLRTEQEAWQDITESIDRGMPVLALGVIGPPECCIVTGYDEDGRALLGYNYFQEYAQEEGLSIDPDGCFRKRLWYDNTPAYFLLRSLKPVTVNEAVYRSILQRAVDLALMPVSNGRPAGLEGYRAWADQLLRDEDDYKEAVRDGDGDMNFVGKEGGNVDFSADVTGRFGMFCDPFLMVCERANAARFCERAAQAVPRWRDELLRAASLYRQVGEDPSPLWQRLGLYDEKQQRFRDADVRSLLAAQILRRRLLEAQAIACVQDALVK